MLISNSKFTLTREFIGMTFRNLENLTSDDLDTLQRICTFQKNLIGQMAKSNAYEATQSQKVFDFQKEKFKSQYRHKQNKQKPTILQRLLQPKIPRLTPPSNSYQNVAWEEFMQQQMSIQLDLIQKRRLRIEEQKQNAIRQQYLCQQTQSQTHRWRQQQQEQQQQYYLPQKNQHQKHLFQWRQQQQQQIHQRNQQQQPGQTYQQQQDSQKGQNHVTQQQSDNNGMNRRKEFYI